MERITIKHLRGMADRLNRLTNSPIEPYTRDDSGKLHVNIGNYHISQAYGGYCLHRMCTDGGGVSTPISCGHIPARELYERICAFIRGIESTKD